MQVKLPQQITIAHEVLFQELDHESVMLNLRDDAYYRLDEVGTRLWQFLSETGGVEQVVCQRRTEYQVDDPRLRQDLENTDVITRVGA